MPEDLGERTELPTARRRTEARERGQLGKSAELSAALTLVAGFVLCLVFARELMGGLHALMRHALSAESVTDWVDGEALTSEGPLAFLESLRLAAPLMLIAMGVSYVIGVSQVGFMLSSKILHPELSRLNPLKGIGRMFSRRSVVKGTLDTLKLTLIAFVAAMVIRHRYDDAAALASLPLAEGALVAASIARDLAVWILAVLLLLGMADFAYQRWQVTQDLKMTRQEVKDEHKTTEGDMEVKGRRLRLARQIAMQRISSAVPKSDVVVTNPTHFAVALKYDAGKMHAPRVVAKGADYLAMKIRYLAAAHGVPIVERPPLARALYHEVPVGRDIRPEHYEAVAEVLAYVYRLDRRAAG